MFKKGLVYSALLIGAYLVLSKATAAGDLLKSAGSTYTGVAKTLQGR